MYYLVSEVQFSLVLSVGLNIDRLSDTVKFINS